MGHLNTVVISAPTLNWITRITFTLFPASIITLPTIHYSRVEEFVTPAFPHLLSHSGKVDASRKMHDWAREYKLLDGKENRLTLLNNWEATYFDFNETKLKELLKDTRKLGVDLFYSNT